MTERLLDLRKLADFLGIEYQSARKLHYVATKNRRADTPKKGDLPPPDAVFGRSPVWKPSTIRRWEPTRPGRGTGGGRPKKLTTT